jgi:class 3 adenylate cyclase
MQRQMQALNERWDKLGIGRPLMIRIGINTGTVSVGSFGSKGRMTYTAMGLETNITSRIEKEAEPGRILISHSSYRLLGGAVRCEPRGQIECRGVHYPVSVYVVSE